MENVNVDGRTIKWIAEARAGGAFCDQANELSEYIKECNELWMFVAMVQLFGIPNGGHWFHELHSVLLAYSTFTTTEFLRSARRIIYKTEHVSDTKSVAVLT